MEKPKQNQIHQSMDTLFPLNNRGLTLSNRIKGISNHLTDSGARKPRIAKMDYSWLFLVLLVTGTVSATSRFESVINAQETDFEVEEAWAPFQSRIVQSGCFRVVIDVCLPGIHDGNATISFPWRTTTTTPGPSSPGTSATTTSPTTTSTTTTTTTMLTTSTTSTSTSSPTTTTTITSTSSPSPTPSCYNDQFDCPTTNYVCTNRFICINMNTGYTVSITKCSTDCPAASCPASACRPCSNGSPQKVCATPLTSCTNNLLHCSKRNYYCNGALQCVSQTTGASEPATACSTSCALNCGTACTLCAPSKICSI